ADEVMRRAAAVVLGRGGYDLFDVVFVCRAAPPTPAAASRCVAQGATRVVMLPYFLSAGVHVRRDLAALRDELARRYPGVEFRLAEPLGRHPLLLEVVAARAQEAMAPPGEAGVPSP